MSLIAPIAAILHSCGPLASMPPTALVGLVAGPLLGLAFVVLSLRRQWPRVTLALRRSLLAVLERAARASDALASRTLAVWVPCRRARSLAMARPALVSLEAVRLRH